MNIGTNIFHKTMAGTFLAIVLAFSANAQTQPDFPALAKYRNWSVMLGGSLYNRAQLTPREGTLTFDNKPLWSMSAGFEYDLFPGEKWTAVTGLFATLEPSNNFDVSIQANDRPGGGGEVGTDFWGRSYSGVNLSAPILIKYNMQLGNKAFLSLFSGLKVMYYPTSDITYGLFIKHQTEDLLVEVFGLDLESPNQLFHGSLMLGSGLSHDLGNLLLKTNLIYTFNFQNTVEGRYLFDNLASSPRSSGDYELSGNHLSLQFLISFKRKEQ